RKAALQMPEHLAGVARRMHVVSERSQNLLDRRAYAVIARKHRYSLIAAGQRRQRCGPRHRIGGLVGGPRKQNGNDGAPPRRAVDRDRAPRLLREPAHHAETETGAALVALGREERLEIPVEILV